MSTAVSSTLLLFFILFYAPILSADEPSYEFLQLVFQNPSSVNELATQKYSSQINGEPINIVSCWPLTFGTFDSSKELPSYFQTRLAYSWPNLVKSGAPVPVMEQNQWIWDDEYIEHGSCARKIMSAVQYFSLASTWFRIINIDNILAQKNITQGKKIDVAEFEKAIADGIDGNQPRLLCNGQILTKVIICLNQRGVDTENCNTPSNCTGDLETKIFGIFAHKGLVRFGEYKIVALDVLKILGDYSVSNVAVFLALLFLNFCLVIWD